ncbi:unnamed protein product [Linum trigynum]|uniref:Secreted protein n=1 Tax=Linum trigynum TaxID=586398 RepID=A0AAV2GLL0_9ROSI
MRKRMRPSFSVLCVFGAVRAAEEEVSISTFGGGGARDVNERELGASSTTFNFSSPKGWKREGRCGRRVENRNF